MVGGSLSCTDTVNPHVMAFAVVSTERYVTVVMPLGKRELFAGPTVCVVEATWQLSETVGRPNVVTAPQTPTSVVFDWLVGQTITGGVWSTTEKLKLHDAVFVPGMLSNAPNPYVYAPTGN